MNKSNVKKVFAISYLILSLSTTFLIKGFAAETTAPVALSMATQSKVWLVGDSTFHEYSSTTTKINSTIEIQAPADKNQSLSESIKNGLLKKLEVSIPVKEMKSGKNQLDKNMQKALKADDFPSIIYKLANYQTVPSASGFQIKTTGTLQIAGVEKPVDLEGTVTQSGDGVKIVGTKNLLMTDYGVKPPSILMIKTKNEISIFFNLLLEKPADKK